MKKMIARILVFVLAFTMVSVCQAQAASKETGTYYKTYKVEGDVYLYPTYGVTINKVKNNKITFQVAYAGRNGSPLYMTKVITAGLKNNAASFKWEDSWENKGTGRMKLYNGYVKIKMKQTKDGPANRYTLDTQGKYVKIMKKSENKKVDTW